MLKSYIGFLLIGTVILAIAAGFDKGPIWCGYVFGAGMMLLGVLSWINSTVVVFKTSGDGLAKALDNITKTRKAK